MLGSDRVYMLAADHRWQWEEWCDAHAVDRARIPDVKSSIVDAFLLARGRSESVARSGSLLLDMQYAAASIARAQAAGVPVGTPAEKAGAFPLTWPTDQPFPLRPPGSFIKVLIKDRADYGAALRSEQFAKVAALQAWCRSSAVPLVIEVLVPRKDEPEGSFDDDARPAMLAQSIRDAYARGIEPQYWKLEGTTSAAGARLVDAAILERPACRQIILGKGADSDLIAKWFSAAASCSSAVGFAIGRSVHWGPGTAFLEGTIDRSEAVDRMAAAYLSLVDMWTVSWRSPSGLRTQG